MAFVVKLDDELDRAVAVVAARLNCSKSSIVVKALEMYLQGDVAATSSFSYLPTFGWIPMGEPDG